MMIYPLISYIKFLLKSTNKHGVHSPFVFNFMQSCLNINGNPIKNDFQKFLYLKKQLLNDKSTITITDYGSGSKHFKGNERQISDIAKYAGISKIKAKILIAIVNYYKPKMALEIGTSLGLATSILSRNNQTNVTTIEGCNETSQIAKKYLIPINYITITYIVNQFEVALPTLTTKKSYDLIYFDGNHQKEATLNYFNLCLKTIKSNTLFIFDDIYLNKPMQEAWLNIIAHPKVTVSIDIYHYGIIFFRKEQPKQHFYLRAFS